MSTSLDNGGKTSWLERITESYRLVVYRADDFKEIRTHYVSLANLYVIIAVFFFVIVALVVSFIFFTPAKKLVPGYGDIEASEEFIQLVKEVDLLSERMEAQQTYIAALQTVIRSNEESLDPSSPAPQISQLPLNQALLASNSNGLSTNRMTSRVADASIYLSLLDARVISPVNGIVSADFEPALKHFGIDILAPRNTPVRSIMDGFVFLSGWDLEDGYTIGIQHENNILSFYKHNSVLLKEKGTFVAAGEAVAVIGNTGTLSSGPHLHFELWHNGRPVNPKDFVNFE